MANFRNDWFDIDFRPAPAGWRAFGIAPDGTAFSDPIAGWLIQERETTYGTNDRRVAPAVHNVPGFGIDPVELDLAYAELLWLIRGPGEPDPTADEIADERKRRKASKAA